jgi:hypothetical protein
MPRGDAHSHETLMRLIAERRGSLHDPTQADWADEVHVEVELSDYQADGLSQLIGRADEHRFDLYVVNNPLPEAARSQRLEAELEELDGRLRATVGDRPNVSVISSLPRFFESQLCATLTHLSPLGARRHSENVARWIRRLDRPR